MYAPHESFVSPADPVAKVWRYLDFTKLVSLLESRALYFAQVERLADSRDQRGDPFEGSYPRSNIATRPQDLYPFAPEHQSEHMVRLMGEWTDVVRVMRRMTFVNCWHLSEHESAAMWRLYLSSGEGIAIQSTFARLTASFCNAPEEVNVGLVKYLDYQTERIDPLKYFASVLTKRKSYEHERELRAVVSQSDPVPTGVDLRDHKFPVGVAITVNLATLIEAVYVAPTAAPWFAALTQTVLRRYGSVAPVHQSDLLAQPLF